MLTKAETFKMTNTFWCWGYESIKEALLQKVKRAKEEVIGKIHLLDTGPMFAR